MDRLLTPHRPPHIGPVNIHEVCERVRSLILAEFPEGMRIVRDYDASLPEIAGRPGAAHPGGAQHRPQRRAGLSGARARAPERIGEIVLRTRVARR